MNVTALTDFGSTYTKVTLVDDATGCVLARAQSPTTADRDVMEGHRTALEQALGELREPFELVAELAASSAGGGLRMAAAGLVAELTAAAGRQAALNAGARVQLVLAGDLGDEDRAALERAAPEILLFCGGTDGGQRAKVLQNADALAASEGLRHVVVACNNEIAGDVATRFRRNGRTVQVVDNVLPEIDRLTIEPARSVINDTFIGHVIHGKGLSASVAFGSMVLMPTPEAVLGAVRLLAGGTGDGESEPETSGVIVVDVGGATTDVHSAVPEPDRPAYITSIGLPVLPVLRSVQGDLGLRAGAAGVLANDERWLLDTLGGHGIDRKRLRAEVARRNDEPGYLADDEMARRIDDALVVSCVTHAVQRHCGSLSTVYRPGQGTQFVQRGADLREVPILIGTGGVFVHHPRAESLLRKAVDRCAAPALTPRHPRLVIDRQYLLAPAGLLATRDPRAAHRLLASLRKEIDHVGAGS